MVPFPIPGTALRLELDDPWPHAVTNIGDLNICLMDALYAVVTYAFNGGPDEFVVRTQRWTYPDDVAPDSMVFQIITLGELRSRLRFHELAATARSVGYVIASTGWKASLFEIVDDANNVIATGYFGPRYLINAASNTTTTATA